MFLHCTLVLLEEFSKKRLNSKGSLIYHEAISFHIYMYVCIYIDPSINAWIYAYLYLSVFIFIHLAMYLSIAVVYDSPLLDIRFCVFCLLVFPYKYNFFENDKGLAL